MPKKTPERLSERIKMVSWLVGIVWTAIVIGFLWHDIAEIRQTSLEMAKREAATHFNMDWATRLWASSHGGVYVPVECS